MALFVNYLMNDLRGPGVMRNAREAASQCSAPWVENATLLQRRLREALVDFYEQSAGRTPRSRTRQAPSRKPSSPRWARRSKAQRSCRSSGCQHLSEIEWQYAQAVAREEEIARNRRRPRRKALYPC